MKKNKNDHLFLEDKEKGFWQTFFDENHKIPSRSEEQSNRIKLYSICLLILIVWFSRTFL